MLATRPLVLAVSVLAVCVARGAAAQPPSGTLARDAAHATQDPDPSAGTGFVATLRRVADDTQIVARLNGDIDGWYPRFGGITRGSGAAVGPGYRMHLLDGRLFVDVSAALSIRGYGSGDARIRWLRAFGDRVEAWTSLRIENLPQEDFFGPGDPSSRRARTSYDFDSRSVTVTGRLRPTPWLSGDISVGYTRPRIGPGSDDRYPSIEQVFTDAQAPGLAEQPGYLHATFAGAIDTRDQPGNPRTGGVYRASFGMWDDRTLERYGHHRFDAVARHYVPLTASRRHVLSGQLGLAAVNNETGQRVPFYFLPYIGGVDTVRSYHEFRFKDENAIWLGAEYHWTIADFVSVATFADAGEVRADWRQIGLGRLRRGFGVGVRVHTRRQALARLDFGTGGGEGWAVLLKVGSQ